MTMGRPVLQFQVLAQDPDRAERFYAEVFGWTIERDNKLGYRQIDTGSKLGIQGGIWPAPPEARPFVQLFVGVPDVRATVDAAQKLGARVVVPPSVLPDGDEMAVVLDLEGIPFGLYRAK